jgi:hypothetical protein
MTRGKGARAEHRFDPRLVVRKEGVVRGPVCILFVLIKIATTIEIRNQKSEMSSRLQLSCEAAVQVDRQSPKTTSVIEESRVKICSSEVRGHRKHDVSSI